MKCKKKRIARIICVFGMRAHLSSFGFPEFSLGLNVFPIVANWEAIQNDADEFMNNIYSIFGFHSKPDLFTSLNMIVSFFLNSYRFDFSFASKIIVHCFEYLKRSLKKIETE